MPTRTDRSTSPSSPALRGSVSLPLTCCCFPHDQCLPGLIRTPMMFAQDWKLDEAIAKKVFKKYDKDKDGELNMAELKVVVEKTKS